jgi:hypothetical protein
MGKTARTAMTDRKIAFRYTGGAGGIAAADRAITPWIIPSAATMTARRPARTPTNRLDELIGKRNRPGPRPAVLF